MFDNQEFDDFNYDQTGMGDSSSGVVYVQLKKQNGEPRMLIGKKGEETRVPDDTLSGRLEDLDIVWDTGNTEHNISPHWQVALTVRAKDDAASKAAGELVTKKYLFRFPSISHNFVSQVINVLLAVPMSWNKYIRIALWRKVKNDKPEAKLSVKISPDGTRPATKFQWDEDANCFPGVPKAKVLLTLPDGKKLMDWHEYENFWLSQAKELYQKFHGKPFEKDIPLAKAAVVGDASSQPAPAPAATGSQDAVTKTFKDRLKEAPGSLPDAVVYLNALAEKAFPVAEKKGVNPATLVDLAKAAFPGLEFQEGRFLVRAPGSFDDLPF